MLDILLLVFLGELRPILVTGEATVIAIISARPETEEIWVGEQLKSELAFAIIHQLKSQMAAFPKWKPAWWAGSSFRGFPVGTLIFGVNIVSSAKVFPDVWGILKLPT